MSNTSDTQVVCALQACRVTKHAHGCLEKGKAAKVSEVAPQFFVHCTSGAFLATNHQHCWPVVCTSKPLLSAYASTYCHYVWSIDTRGKVASACPTHAETGERLGGERAREQPVGICPGLQHRPSCVQQVHLGVEVGAPRALVRPNEQQLASQARARFPAPQTQRRRRRR